MMIFDSIPDEGEEVMDNTYDENESIKIISQVDCGNAPKKEFLKQLMTAIAKKDISFITEFTTDAVSLT